MSTPQNPIGPESQAHQYQAPVPEGAIPPAPAKAPRNTIAIVALVVAILAFIFAVMKGAILMGWLLAPVAFVLALVALFKKDTKKGLAIAALIISIIAPIAGVFTFLGAMADAVNDATQKPTTVPATSTPAVTSPAGENPAPADTSAPAEQPAGGKGTRENPNPLGTTIATDDWEVTVNSFTPDATSAVLKENQFNDKPKDGYVYALVNLTVKRLAEKPGMPGFEIMTDFVTAGGNVVNVTDALVVGPEPLSSVNELFKGASVTGNVVLMIPKGDAGVIRVRPGLLSDEVFFATS